MAVRVWWRTVRIVAFAIVSLGTIHGGVGAMPAPPADDPLAFPVRVDNFAAIRADDLQFAEGRASEVFQKIGIRVQWVDVDSPIAAERAPRFTLIVTNSDAKVGSASVFVDALGLAHPPVRRAYVFYDRVAALNERSPRPIQTILGDVIADELGHLVLPTASHSRAGIMRAGLDMKQLSVVTFTDVEARAIVAGLTHAPTN